MTPFVAAGHAAPILSHSGSAQLLPPPPSHPPQLYTQGPAVSLAQAPAVQQIGAPAPPPPPQPVSTGPPGHHPLTHPQMAPHPNHPHHHHHHPQQHPSAIVSPFASPHHTHVHHQIPPPPSSHVSILAKISGNTNNGSSGRDALPGRFPLGRGSTARYAGRRMHSVGSKVDCHQLDNVDKNRCDKNNCLVFIFVTV